MTRFRLWTTILAAPAFAATLAAVGCGGGDKATTSSKPTSSSSSTTTGGSTTDSTTSSREAPTAIEPQGFATIKGKVTYDGTPPVAEEIHFPENLDKNSRDVCLMGEHRDQTWVVGADKGVKNVVIWLRPPEHKFFDVPADQQKPERATVTVDQPYCAFIPHVDILFPTFYDAATKKQKRTGQTFEIHNSAPITHNTNWNPLSTLLDSGDNVILPSKKVRKIDVLNLKPSPNQQDLLSFKCDIHKWMTSYIWAFDHPYAAVTKEDGTYEIKNVPAGSKLILIAWHEPGSYYTPTEPGTNKGTEIGPLTAKEVKVINFDKVSK